MKIGNPTDKVTGGSSSQRAEGASTAASGKTTTLDGGVSQSAKVSLSPMASSLISGSDPDFDADKVGKVKQSIDSGTYHVDAEVIADKLISNAQELLKRKSN
ncbi:MAG: flagellar biosynthesis anti-sigma factor FlgM [Burkholderiales bacterium]|nr:flagellar biosynthesis anti-sigma factor FlgM [Burkholderiales bacterium]MDE2432624.1 flagellar biosynthesis anti-sigma factor FlgM [Burkholderiales bacterium]